MSRQKIRHQVRDANRQLDLGANPDLHSIQSWIEARHGRPITITQLDTIRGDDLCGMCATFEDRILVVHAPPKSS